MLKTTAPSERSISEKLGVDDGKDDGYGIGGDGVEHAKKSRKLSKSQKLTKLRKKLSKSGNLPNFNAKKAGPSFLTSDAREAFNRLWLAFTKAPILWHFNPKYHN